MTRRKPALAALLSAIALATPAAAQQALLTPERPASEHCSGCFAYLVFPPEPEAGAASNRASRQPEPALPAAAAQPRPIVAPPSELVALSKQ